MGRNDTRNTDAPLLAVQLQNHGVSALEPLAVQSCDPEGPGGIHELV